MSKPGQCTCSLGIMAEVAPYAEWPRSVSLAWAGQVGAAGRTTVRAPALWPSPSTSAPGTRLRRASDRNAATAWPWC